MRPINKRNFFPIVCIVYTCLSIINVVVEGIFWDYFSRDHLNALVSFVFCMLVVFALSQQERIFRLPFILAVITQYILVETLMLLMTWVIGHFVELAESAFRDLFISSSVIYIILNVIYVLYFHIDLKRHNDILKKIKQKSEQGCSKTNP